MKLNFRKYGDGHPLIILHGVFGSSDNWQTLGKDFADHFQVYLVDQRNHGKSPHSDTFDYPSMAEDINQLLTDENISSAFFLGHSMGGKTAMKFSSLFPKKVDKLIVVDIAPKEYPPHHEEIIKGFKAVNLKEIETRKDAEEQMKKVIDNQMVRLFLLKNLTRDKDGFAWKINLPVIESNIDTIGKGLDENEVFEGETLFIGGKKSDYIQSDDSQKIRQHFPDARIQMIDGAGHWVHAEKPKELYDAVVNFLS